MVAFAPNFFGGGGDASNSIVPVSSPASLTLYKSSDFLASVEVNLPINWSVLLWTVKDGREVDSSLDTDALVQIRLTNGGDAGDGLAILNREAAADASLGSLAVNDTRTAVIITLGAAAIAAIEWVKKTAQHDFAVHTDSGGKPLLVPPGLVTFRTNVTRTLPA
jgi:hypothetical protein